MDVSVSFAVPPASAISQRSFNDGKHTPVTCRMLHWPELETRVFQSAGGDIVEIPCVAKPGGAKVSMIVIIPKAGWQEYLGTGMSRDQLFQLLFKLEPKKIEFLLPVLRGNRNGLQLIREGDGQSPDVSRLLQRVHIYINESGAQCAAATIEVCGMACVSDLPYLAADRPFAIVYVDFSRSEILFSGIVNSVPDQ